MPALQHKPQIVDRIVKAMRLRRVNKANAIAADLGKAHRDTGFLCTSAEHFWREYPLEVVVASQKIQCSPECLPLPIILREKLLAKNRRYQQTLAFRNRLRDVASDVEVLTLSNEVTTRRLKVSKS